MTTMRMCLHFALSAVVLLLGGASAFAQHAQDNVQIAHYRNVGSAAITSGTAVIFILTDSDTSTGTDRTAASTLGLDVTTTTTADSRLFAGVLLDNTCESLAVCRFVIRGPTIVRWAGSTDTTNTVGNQIGTTTVAGNLGSGVGAGILLSTALVSVPGQDNSLRWVYVDVNPDQ